MIRIEIPIVRQRAVQVLVSAGVRQEDAEAAVDHMITADLWGRSTHGLSQRFAYVMRQAAEGAGSSAVEVLRDAGHHVLVEGHNSLGYPAARFCTRLLIERVVAHGLACVALRNTRHTGMLGYYTDMGARCGVITLAFANCYPLVAPYGGTRPLLGTNPVSVGFPSEPDPILVDMATSAITVGDLTVRELRGDRLPDGVALDPDGKPTTDPAAARAGCFLPFGGHRGGALAVAVQLLSGVFTGSPAIPPFAREYGLLLLGLRKDLFQPPECYDAAVADFVARYHSVRASPDYEVRLPGSRRYEILRSRQDNRVEVSEELAALLGLKESSGG